ncbi:MAG: hypothetical protein HQ483_15535 [Rhodospirillales bacterium]|nr:hypothetical protein [Rhodospirillales bacterium]
MNTQDDKLGKAYQRTPAEDSDEPTPATSGATSASAEIINVRDSKFQQRPRDEGRDQTRDETAQASSAPNRSEPNAAPPVRESAKKKAGGQPSTVAEEPVAEPSPEAANSAWRERTRNTAAPFVVGGLSGAAMAVLAVFLINKLSPPMDPRMQPMAIQLSAFIDRMDLQEAGLQSVQVDLIKLIEDGEKSTGDLNERDARIAMAMTEVESVRRELRAENGVGSPVFNVAVVQLVNAVSSGLPFESEWVTLYALTSAEPELRAHLQRLLPMARNGVETIAFLRQELKQMSLDNGIPNNSNNQGLVHLGTMFLQTQLGIPVGNTPIEQVMAEFMRELDNRLLVGDLSGAILQLEELKGEYTDTFSPWLEQARRRQIAGEVADALRDIAKIRLQERAATKPASAANATQ